MRLRYVIGILLLAGAAYFAVFGGEYSLVEVRRVKRELALEQERLVQARADLARLQARVDSLQNDSATIVRIARERWGMIAPGERLYRFEEGDTSGNRTFNERERARPGTSPDSTIRP